MRTPPSWFNSADRSTIAVRKKQGERRWLDAFPSMMSGSPLNWTGDRYKQSMQFKDWPYIAIHAAAQEAAIRPPTVANVVPAEEKEQAIQKALRDGGQDLARLARRKYLNLGQKRKALIHVQGDDEVRPVPQNHPLVKIYANPNPLDCYWTWAYKLSMYLDLTGSAYLRVFRNKLGEVCALWPIPSHWVREIPGDAESGKIIKAYEIRPAMGFIATEWGLGWFPSTTMGGRAIWDEKDVIAFRYPSPISYIDGYSPLSAVAPWIDCSSSIDISRVYAFRNNSMPGVVVEIDKDMNDPGPEEIERIKARIEAEWQGVRNNKRPVVLAPGMKLAPYAQNTSQEMEYHLSADQMASNILSAFGVGKSLVGITELTTYANADAASLNFYRSRMKPRMALIGQILSPWSQEAFDDPTLHTFWPDPTPEDPELKLRMEDQDLRTGVRTINEIREERGYEPYEYGGDNPLLPMGLHEIAWKTGEPDPIMQQVEQQAQGGAQPGGAPGGALAPPPTGGGDDDPADQPASQGQTPDDFDIQQLLGGKQAGGDGANGAAAPKNRLSDLMGKKGLTNGHA